MTDSKPTYSIRGYQDSDAAPIRRIFAETHQAEAAVLSEETRFEYMIAIAGEVGSRLSDVGQYYATLPNQFFIAAQDGKPDDIAGFCALIHVDEDTAELKNVAIHPDRQGLGIARLLMDAFEQSAREAGYRRGVLWTYENLAVALGMYRRRGWKERPFELEPDMIEELGPIYMELDLTAPAGN